LVGRWFLFTFLLGGGTSILWGQASPTASRSADAQFGIGITFAKTGYLQDSALGFAAYGDLDLTPHLGIEAELHQVDSTTGDRVYERTYEIGGRYFRAYGPIVPYVKALVGRGVLNYQYNLDNLAYNMYAGGIGTDIKIGEFLRVRCEYEYQKWSSFQNGGVSPQLATLGVAYHFAGKPRIR
jgi:hypothetical protein